METKDWNTSEIFVEFKFDKHTEWETFVPIKDMDIPTPVLKIPVGDKLEEVQVKSESFVPFVYFEGTNEDYVFADNAFAITDHEIYQPILY